MRTNSVIDDALVQLSQQAEFRHVRGKLRWEGSLHNQRLDGPATPESGEPA